MSRNGWSPPRRMSMTRRRTGRYSPRTTRSVITARRSIPSCAGSPRPAAGRTTTPPAPGSAAGWSFGRPRNRCPSTGTSDGIPLRGLSGEQLRQVIYLSLFPNVLLSLHPDYVMTHLVRPLGPDRTLIECSWAFAPEAVARPGIDPAYARDFWDPPNRQGRGA